VPGRATHLGLKVSNLDSNLWLCITVGDVGIVTHFLCFSWDLTRSISAYYSGIAFLPVSLSLPLENSNDRKGRASDGIARMGGAGAAFFLFFFFHVGLWEASCTAQC